MCIRNGKSYVIHISNIKWFEGKFKVQECAILNSIRPNGHTEWTPNWLRDERS